MTKLSAEGNYNCLTKKKRKSKDMELQKTALRKRTEDDGMVWALAENALYILLGVVICRGKIFGSLAPFGASYVSAVPRKKLLFATFGTALGYVILMPENCFRYVAVSVSTALLRWLIEDYKLISKSAVYQPAAAFLPIFASGIALIFVRSSTVSDISKVAVEAVVAGAVAYFFSRAVFLLTSGRRPTTLSQSEAACLVMSGCALILSLSSIEFEKVSLGRIAAVIIILLCARYGSVAGGAISGASTGSIFGMSSVNFAFICAGYSFGGLIGGLFAPFGKAGTALGFIVCNAVMLLSAGDNSLILPMFVETIIGAAVFMILPKDIERHITPVFLPKENTKGERSLRNSIVMRLDFASGALQNVSGCVNSVSRQLKKLYAPDVEYIYRDAARDVCENCGMMSYCWDRHKNTTSEDFKRLSAPLKTQGYITESDVEDLFSKKCCRKIEVADSINNGYRDYLGGIEASARVTQIRSMVAGQFSGLSEILGDMAKEFENYKTFDADCASRVKEYLHRHGFIVMECGCMIDNNGRMSVEIELSRSKAKLNKDALAKDISSICARCFDTPIITQIGNHRRIVLSEVPVFDVEVGVYQHVFGGGKLCGDCVNCFVNGFGQFVALISDGMGTGGRAAVDSNMTVSILTNLLKAGLSENCALRVVNSALMVKSEDESLSTVDMINLDLFSGKAVMNKAGAPFSYVKKGGRLLKKSSKSLPVGILGDVKFASDSVNLRGGDVIVMVSDGATLKDEKWLEEIIRNFKDNDNCSDLAKTVVNEAIKRRNDGHDDDITAVAVRVIDN